MTFRDIAEKGKPETDNLIVLKIVLRCQNSSHTFSNLFNKKPEDSHLSDVSSLSTDPWSLDFLTQGIGRSCSIEPWRDCLKMSSLRYPGLKQSITLTYGQEVGGLCHQPCLWRSLAWKVTPVWQRLLIRTHRIRQLAYFTGKHPQFTRNSGWCM